jgi:hypothetical protein
VEWTPVQGLACVHVAYACGDFHALLDGESFLPERWNANPTDSQSVGNGLSQAVFLPNIEVYHRGRFVSANLNRVGHEIGAAQRRAALIQTKIGIDARPSRIDVGIHIIQHAF